MLGTTIITGQTSLRMHTTKLILLFVDSAPNAMQAITYVLTLVAYTCFSISPNDSKTVNAHCALFLSRNAQKVVLNYLFLKMNDISSFHWLGSRALAEIFPGGGGGKERPRPRNSTTKTPSIISVTG